MPTTVTDYHEQVRDAVLDALKAALPDLPWETVDSPDDAAGLTRPVGVVCAVGPEQERPEWTSNLSDGRGYPVAVLLVGAGTTRGEQRTGPLSITGFRRLVTTTFNNKRLAAVARVGWCEVQDSGELIDEKSPLFQTLQTALVVTAVGRFPRT